MSLSAAWTGYSLLFSVLSAFCLRAGYAQPGFAESLSCSAARGRVFIGYNNYYHAIVVGEQSFVNSNDGYKFLDSMDVH